MVIKFIIVAIVIFMLAIFMTMVGKGGGNFYVLILVIADVAMHEAAATGQFILSAASFSALFVFQKNKKVVWPIAVLIGISTSLAAFLGGYFSHIFSGNILKIIFIFLIFSTGILILIPISSDNRQPKINIGIWTVSTVKNKYSINLWIVLPLTVLIGFASGMSGVSGGSFLVPLMVLACGLPMHIAVGTASTLIAATAFMGFIGHAIQGDFNPTLALPLAGITIIGGIIGGKWALSAQPRNLKQLFALSNIAAALFMFIHIIQKN